MKRVGVVLCTVFLAGACRIAHAGESWLLLSHQSGEDGLSDNALIYLDQATASIDKMTPEGATVMHQVSADEASHGVRIPSIDSQ
jgi:hypothetical protein